MLDAIADRLAPGGLVIFGELHGTMEVPAFVAFAAEHAAARGPVVVAMELPDDVQPGVDAFLAAPDDATGRAALVATPSCLWQFRDGRGGEGLVVLLARMRALRDTGHDVRVLCFDGSVPSTDVRDSQMAAKILAGVTPAAAVIVSCGNVHARTDAPQFMGWHLRDVHPDLLSLDIRNDGGHAFVALRESSGVTAFGKERGDPRRGVILFEARHAYGYDGEYHVGPITPSLPLVGHSA